MIDKALAIVMIDKLRTHGDPLQLALLTAAPTVTAGVYSIAGVEASGATCPGYTRATLPLSALGATGSNAPTAATTTSPITFTTNTADVPWPLITHIALLDSAGTAVLAVAECITPIEVTPQLALFIAAGSLTFDAGTP